MSEAPVHKLFNYHLSKNFSCIPGEVGDMESKWAVFKVSIVETVMAAVKDLVGPRVS